MKNKIQESELCLAIKLKKICEDNQLKYFMLGGAMLGAVRHKGFIPWDDDMDFGLLREDYEKLYSLLSDSSDLEVLSYKNGGTHDYPFKVIDPRVEITSGNYENAGKSYAWIDVFPIDGMPKNRFLVKLHMISLLKDRALLKLSQLSTGVAIKNPNRTNLEKVIIFIGKKLHLDSFFNEDKMFKKLDKHLKKYATDNSEELVNFMGAYKFKEMFPKSMYVKNKNYSFENTFFQGIEDYDSYLKQLYGDYMTPPATTDRNKHQTKLKDE